MTGENPGDAAGIDGETPDGFDANAVIERWREIEERGHPIPNDDF